MSSKPHHEVEQDQTMIKISDNKWKFNPRGFSIIWGNDKRYWSMPEKGKTEEAAELVQVCWLELTGSTREKLELGKYSIRFTISMKEGAFGWNDCPVFMMAKIGKKGKYTWKRINLSSDKSTEPKAIPDDFVIEVKSDNTDDPKLYFGLYEVWTGKWKGGLLIHNAIVEKVA